MATAREPPEASCYHSSPASGLEPAAPRKRQDEFRVRFGPDHRIHRQDDEAVRRCEEYRKRNRPPKPENWKGDVQ